MFVILCGNPVNSEIKMVGPFEQRKDAEIYMWYRYSATKIFELEAPKTIDNTTPYPLNAC